MTSFASSYPKPVEQPVINHTGETLVMEHLFRRRGKKMNRQRPVITTPQAGTGLYQQNPPFSNHRSVE
jgi:hypothetical protein